jgi:hypothetical protein
MIRLATAFSILTSFGLVGLITWGSPMLQALDTLWAIGLSPNEAKATALALVLAISLSGGTALFLAHQLAGHFLGFGRRREW